MDEAGQLQCWIEESSLRSSIFRLAMCKWHCNPADNDSILLCTAAIVTGKVRPSPDDCSSVLGGRGGMADGGLPSFDCDCFSSYVAGQIFR